MHARVRLILSVGDWKAPPFIVERDVEPWPYDVPIPEHDDYVTLGSVAARVVERTLHLDPVVETDVTLTLSGTYVSDTPKRVEELSHEGWTAKEDHPDGREKPEAAKVGEAGPDGDQGIADEA